MESQTGEEITLKKRAFTLSYIRPCTTKPGTLTAEAQLNRSFGKAEVCDLIAAKWPGADLNPEIGVAIIDKLGNSISVFSSGKVNIRSAKDAEAILGIIKQVCAALGVDPGI